ncbi:hypothetical protein CDAR_297601 [Caerostris darwini]|uniref:Uncharacterized protein n=1 Tax=Caerostris darwini TaxID=1538125 RepID=A0AAV4PNW2_9ARAC|nr:hypothetical protein CDAR_297601 [Caerostris darwini]
MMNLSTLLLVLCITGSASMSFGNIARMLLTNLSSERGVRRSRVSVLDKMSVLIGTVVDEIGVLQLRACAKDRSEDLKHVLKDLGVRANCPF